jgi:lysophospholipase L1-like esterase
MPLPLLSPTTSSIVPFGDSITESGGAPAGWCTLLQARLDASRPSAHRIHIAGFGGRQSGELLDRMGEHVLPHLPGLVLLGCGINDAYYQAWQRIPRVSLGEYRRNMAEIVRVVRERGGEVVLLAGHDLVDSGIFVQGNGRPQPENYRHYQQEVPRLAGELGTPCIDLAARLAAAGIAPAHVLAKDGVHLSADGHAWYARIIGDALLGTP